MNGVLTMIQASTSRCGLGLREAGGCGLQAGREFISFLVPSHGGRGSTAERLSQGGSGFPWKVEMNGWNVFMQKEVRLSRFQSVSYTGGHSC